MRMYQGVSAKNMGRTLGWFVLLICLVSAVSIMTNLAFAQNETDPLASPSQQWRKQGQLVSIQIVKGNPVRIFVVGREEAKLDLSNLKLTVKRLKPYPGKVLTVDRAQNYFVIPNTNEFNKVKDLEIQTIYNGQSETLRLDLDQNLP